MGGYSGEIGGVVSILGGFSAQVGQVCNVPKRVVEVEMAIFLPAGIAIAAMVAVSPGPQLGYNK